MKRDPQETRALILKSALKEISRKGFADATIRQIASNAKVTALTVFRHFSDKDNLFACIIKEYSKMEIDKDHINSLLTYDDLLKDLITLSQEYFKTLFNNLDILRIFINEAYNNKMVKKEAWFLSPVLKEHFKEYLNAAKLGGNDKDILCEMFVAHITRRVLEYNTHDSIWEYSDELLKDFSDRIKSQLIWFEQVLQCSKNQLTL